VQKVLAVGQHISICIQRHVHERHPHSDHAAAFKVAASHEVQWLLLFRLACIVQLLPSNSSKRQQHKSKSVEQLLVALQIPTGSAFNELLELQDPRGALAEVLQAVRVQLRVSQQLASHQNAAVAATRYQQQEQQQQQPPVAQTQQQQQQLDSLLRVTLPVHLVQPLALTLVHLCTDLSHSTTDIAYCLIVLHQVTAACVSMASSMEHAAHTSSFAGVSASELIAASAAYQSVLCALAEPLLCQLGPAVLKATRQLEREQSSSSSTGQAGSSSSKAQREAEMIEIEQRMRMFGKIVLQLFPIGKFGVITGQHSQSARCVQCKSIGTVVVRILASMIVGHMLLAEPC
jgi:hypothetical protein